MELIFEIVFNSTLIGSRRGCPIGLARLASYLAEARGRVVKRRPARYVIEAPSPEHAGLVPELVMLIVHRLSV